MEQNLLKMGIGTKEYSRLQAKTVLIEKVEVQAKTKGNIVECFCAHPDRQDHVKISKVKIELKSKLSVAGLWLNTDDDDLIVKSSALAKFLMYMNCKTIEELQGKTCSTVEDESGYLVLKGY